MNYKIKNVKIIKTIFYIFLLILVFLPNSCKKEDLTNIKNNFIERTKIFLSNIPFIKKYITLPPPPIDLYKNTQEIIKKLKDLDAEKIYKKDFEKLLKDWEKAKKLYKKKYYKKAETYLKKIYKEAKELLERVKAYKETLKINAWKKYKIIENRAQKLLSKKKKEERIKIELYLWKLRNLINLERYEEFEKELQNPPF